MTIDATEPNAVGSSTGPRANAGNERHFSTDHLMSDLKGRSVRGGVVTLSGQAVKFVLQLLSTMVLARLLSPADFGLVAMVTAFTGFALVFKDAGLSMATVQRERISQDQVSTLFWINVALSGVIMCTVAAFAPGIAWFYGEPRLVGITLGLACTFLFSGFTVQHQALLRRQMRFSALAVIEILSMTVGLLTAVVMAWLEFGYWSLVGHSVGGVFTNCLLVWAFSGWRPGRPVKRSGVRPMLAFGGNLTAFSALNYLRRNVDNVLIGTFTSAASLGLYTKAYSLLMLPIRQLNGPLTSVAVPLLSRLVPMPGRYVRAYRVAIGTLAVVSVPIPILLAVVADAAILVVLGNEWLEAAGIFRVLALGAAVDALNVTTGWVYVSCGHARRQLNWGLFQSIAFIAAFVVGVRWGALGVAFAYSIVLTTLKVPGVIYCFRGTPLKLRDFLSAVWPAYGAACLAGIVTAIVLENLPDSLLNVTVLAVAATVFAPLYVALVCTSGTGRRAIGMMFTLSRKRRDAKRRTGIDDQT